MANEAHKGQYRRSIANKVEYILHPVTVALYIQEYKKSSNIEDLIIAALLHDTVEDTFITIDVINKEFGETVCEIVNELTSDKEECKKMGKTNYLLQKMLKMTNYSLTIKLADRLDNVNDLFDFINLGTEKDKKFALKYIKETKFIIENLEKLRLFTETQSILANKIKNKINFL